MANDPLILTGTQSDAVQLEVNAHSPQTHPLQTWRAGGNTLAQITQEGRLEVGEQAVASSASAALIEANQNINSGSAVLQGLQTRGIASGAGAINQALTWSLHELDLGGSGGIGSNQTALTARVIQNNSGGGVNANLRAAIFEVQNNVSLKEAVAVRGAVSNGSGASITDAIAFDAALPTTSTVTNAYGLRVADINIGTNKYAIYTGTGMVRLGGSVGIGTSPSQKLHVAQETNALIALFENTLNQQDATNLLFRKARGTLASKLKTADFDYVGRLNFQGWDGQTYLPVAMIDAVVWGDANLNDMPGALVFYANNNAAGSNLVQQMTVAYNGVTIHTALNKPGGSFLIDHPLDPANRNLSHSFVEGPRADLIYRGKVTLSQGKASVSIDTVNRMTPGTFEALTRHAEAQVWVQNETGWEPVRGKIVGGTLEIECKDAASSDTVSWLVVSERADAFMQWSNLTDDEGHFIVEGEKPIPTAEALKALEPRLDETVTEASREAVFSLNGKRGYPMYPEAIGLTQPTREVRPQKQVAQTDEQV